MVSMQPNTTEHDIRYVYDFIGSILHDNLKCSLDSKQYQT